MKLDSERGRSVAKLLFSAFQTSGIHGSNDPMNEPRGHRGSRELMTLMKILQRFD